MIQYNSTNSIQLLNVIGEFNSNKRILVAPYISFNDNYSKLLEYPIHSKLESNIIQDDINFWKWKFDIRTRIHFSFNAIIRSSIHTKNGFIMFSINKNLQVLTKNTVFMETKNENAILLEGILEVFVDDEISVNIQNLSNLYPCTIVECTLKIYKI